MDKVASKRVLDMDVEWDLVKSLLPAGWADHGKTLGAVRRLRGIGSVESLLRILLLHLVDGCSLKETATRARQSGLGTISSVGIFKRLRAAERWLAWMAAALWRHTWPVAGRHCIAVDATTVCEAGRTGRVFRVHWCVNLANLQCEFLQLTDVHGGEKFARFPVPEGSLVLGDRGYSNPAGIDHVRQSKGHVLVRVNPMSLPLYDRRDGTPMDVLAEVADLACSHVRAMPAWVKGAEGRWHCGRLVAVRKSEMAKRRELRRRKSAMNSKGRKLGKRGRALAGYVLLWTSLPRKEMGPRMVLRCYRRRWQLELVFKRVKSIMGLGRLPKYSDASSRAWLNGKLLVAMLVEKLWQHAEHFSPWGYRLPRPPQPMA